MTTTTPAELRAAALRIVTERGVKSLAGEESYGLRPYVESHHVLRQMQDAGLIPSVQASTPYYEREQQLAKYTRQAKVILDQLAKDGELLRFSSRSAGLLPYPTGRRQSFSGNMVGYITPAAYEQCEQRCVAADAADQAEADALDALLTRAEQAGLPMPVRATTTSVTYSPDQLRRIIELCRS